MLNIHGILQIIYLSQGPLNYQMNLSVCRTGDSEPGVVLGDLSLGVICTKLSSTNLTVQPPPLSCVYLNTSTRETPGSRERTSEGPTHPAKADIILRILWKVH